MKILKQGIDVTNINPETLTVDCKLVTLSEGRVDLVKEYSSVRIFDYYWDEGEKITDIRSAKGRRNPKLADPEF